MEEKELKITGQITISEISEIAKRFGIEMDSKSITTEFTVKKLGYNKELKSEFEQIKKMAESSDSDIESKKPWWKLW